MKRARLPLLGLALLAISACTLIDHRCAHLPGGGSYCLVSGTWPEYTTEQTSTVTVNGKTLHMITRIASGPAGLRVAGLSPLGQTLFQIEWSDSLLRAELAPAVKGRLDPTLLPALLQIATWPADDVRRGLCAGLELIESTDRRSIRSGQNDVLILSWTGARLPYEHMRIEIPAVGLRIDNRALGAEQ